MGQMLMLQMKMGRPLCNMQLCLSINRSVCDTSSQQLLHKYAYLAQAHCLSAMKPRLPYESWLHGCVVSVSWCCMQTSLIVL